MVFVDKIKGRWSIHHSAKYFTYAPRILWQAVWYFDAFTVRVWRMSSLYYSHTITHHTSRTIKRRDFLALSSWEQVRKFQQRSCFSCQTSPISIKISFSAAITYRYAYLIRRFIVWTLMDLSRQSHIPGRTFLSLLSFWFVLYIAAALHIYGMCAGSGQSNKSDQIWNRKMWHVA